MILSSLVTFSKTLKGTDEDQLDRAALRCLAAVSFILGLPPWSIRQFIQRSAEQVIQLE